MTHTITQADINAGSVSLAVAAGDLGADGAKSISAQFSDAAGNSSTTGALSITLDTTAPTGGTPDLAAASDSGASHTDNDTGVTNPSFTIALGSTVAVGDTVELLLGGSALAHDVTHTITQADINAGSVSLAVAAGDLGADGAKSISAQFSDAAGNSSTTGALSITLDTTAPTGGTPDLAAASDSGASHTDNDTGVTNPSFTIALGSTVAVGDTVELLLGGSALAHDVTHTITQADINAGSVSLAVAAGDLGADGAKSISAQFSDAAGNSSTTGALSITLDTTAPTGGTPDLAAASDLGASHTDNDTGVTNPSFTIALGSTVAVGDTVELLLGGSALAHDVTHTITQADINAGSVSLAVAAGDLGADGAKSISAQFSDAAGNSSTTGALSITLDTTAPTGTVTSDHTSLIANQTATITFHFSEAVAGFNNADVKVTGGTLGSITQSSSDPAVYTATFTPTAEINTTASVIVAAGSYTDIAGNAGASGAASFSENTILPDLLTTFSGLDSNGYMSETRPVAVRVSDDGVDVTAQATYQWQVLQSGNWVQVGSTNSFSQIETYEGKQLRVIIAYKEGGGTDTVTTYLGQIADNDFVDDRGASVRIQNLPGSLQIAGDAALELAALSAVAASFPTAADTYGKLVIDHAASYTGAISNFTGTNTQSDAIDLKDIAFDSGISFTYQDNSGANTGGTLSIRESGHTVDTITFANGDYTTTSFTLSSDGHGGTLITDPPTSSIITGASAVLTTSIDTLTLDNGTHQVSGTDQTVNNGDTLAGGTGANTLTVDSGNGNHGYIFGDGNHGDIGLTNFEKLTLTDANAPTDHAVFLTFDSSFHNKCTLTVDGSGLTHLDGTNLTVDAHLAASDSFVIIGSASADTLIAGSSHNNTITGGGGGDTLTGNGSNDTFNFKSITDSQPGTGNFDTITNFAHNSDHIDFAAISGLNSTVQDVTFNLLTATPASLAAHTIDIVTSGGNTVVYANASGTPETLGHVNMEIHLNNVINVHSTDFILHG